MSQTFVTLNKYGFKKISVPAAESFNKLQNSRTNGDELIKKINNQNPQSTGFKIAADSYP